MFGVWMEVGVRGMRKGTTLTLCEYLYDDLGTNHPVYKAQCLIPAALPGRFEGSSSCLRQKLSMAAMVFRER